MLNAIISFKIINRLIIFFPIDKSWIYFYITVSQKNIPGLRPGRFNMVDTVLFFFRPGEFMFFDHIFKIIIHRRNTNKSCLASAIHDQLVNIIAGFFFLENDAIFYKLLKIVFCFFIHSMAVNIYVIRQVNF